MKIVLAPDKFKNSLTGLEFCNAAETGIKSVLPHAEIIKRPLADGGDGTIDVVNFYLNGSTIKKVVNNPFFNPVNASYLYAEKSNTAYIEMAEASGLKLLKPAAFDCKNATTYGTGELILDAINKGASKIIIGIGGSATNDCGIGMATALGYRFFDKNKQEVHPIGANLSKIKTIDFTHVHPKLKATNFQVACDVTNPLYGKNGATFTYAKQKGATPDDIKMLDEGLQSFSEIIKKYLGVNVQALKGAGAAGGMGAASKVFLNGKLESGIALIKTISKFDEKIKDSNWIITGEGQLDLQTFSGKTIQGVITSAKAKNIRVAAFCGAVDLKNTEVKTLGLNYTDAVLNYSKNFEDAMKNSYEYVRQMAAKFTHTLA